MVEKFNQFYKLLKTEVTNNITSELMETYYSVDKALSDVCELALKQPVPENYLVFMTEAAGYALVSEDNPNQKIQSKRKTYGPVAFDSKNFSPAQLKMTYTLKIFWKFTYHFLSLRSFVGIHRGNNCSDK